MHAAASAALAAIKNAAVSVPIWAAAVAPVSLIEIVTSINPYTTAALFAEMGAIGRWLHFRLSLRSGLSGVFISPVLAFALSWAKLPDWFGYIPPEAAPMLIGVVIGLGPTFVFGLIQDFWSGYQKFRKGGVS